MKNKRFKDNFIYAAGSIGLSAAAFLMTPVFTRLLSPDEYGVVNAYNAYLNVFGAVIGLGLNVSLKNAKYEYRDRFDDFTASVTIFSFFVFAAFFTVAAIINKTNILLMTNSYSFFLFTFISDKFLIEFKHNKALLFQYVNTLSGILLSVVLINLLENKAYGRILGNAMPTIAFGMAIFITLVRKAKFKKEYVRFALSISCPLLAYQISYLILTQFDRVMIGFYSGDFEAGVYSFIFNIGLILNIIYKALWNVWYPWFFKQMDEKNYIKIKSLTRYFIVFFSFISIAFLSIYPELVTVMSPHEYWAGMDLAAPVAIAVYFFFLFGFPLSSLMFYRKNLELSLSAVLAACISIAANALLLPQFGYKSAAFTALFSFVFLFVSGCFHAKKLPKVYYYKDFIIGALAVCSLSYIMFSLKNVVIVRFAITGAIFIITAVVFYKKGVFDNVKNN